MSGTTRHKKNPILDAIDGYHAVELDSESQPLTIFTSKWGRYYDYHRDS